MRYHIVVFLIVASLLLFSCGTMNHSSQSWDSDLLVRGGEENPNKLQKNQFLSVTNTVNNPAYLQATNWSKVRILADFLDELKGHSDFSNEEKYEMLSFIFDDLPTNGKDGVIREVYIGGYFENGDPLIIRVAVMTPSKDATIENDKVLVLFSNVGKLMDGSLIRKEGLFIDLDFNVSLLCGLKNNLLTNINKISNKDESIDTNSMSGIEAVMLAQEYLGDENIENDIVANELVSKNIDNKAEQPSIIIMSMLMQYNYLLSIENIEGAEKLWEDILEYSKQVPGDMTPENLNSINGGFLYQMKRLMLENS